MLTFSNLLASISLVSLFSQLFAYDEKGIIKKLKGTNRCNDIIVVVLVSSFFVLLLLIYFHLDS